MTCKNAPNAVDIWITMALPSLFCSVEKLHANEHIFVMIDMDFCV